MVTSAALGEPICPWGGVAFKRDERHVRRDALTDPKAELGGLKVLEGLFRRGESPKSGRLSRALRVECSIARTSASGRPRGGGLESGVGAKTLVYSR